MVHIFSASSRRKQRIGSAIPGLTLGALLALGGCASMPPPDAAMNQAQMQLQAARDAGGADYAPVDLGFAQGKFQQAQAAMASRQFEDAARLAEESRADSEVARAKARLGSARAQLQAKTDENERLRRQIDASVDDASDTKAAAPRTPTVLQDMPAPSASVLSAPLPAVPAPPSGALPQGFQPAPASSAGTAPTGQPQPAPLPNDGGQP